MIPKRTCAIAALVMLSIAVIPASVLALRAARSAEPVVDAPAVETIRTAETRAVEAPVAVEAPRFVLLDEVVVVAERPRPRRAKVVAAAKIAAPKANDGEREADVQRVEVCSRARPLLAGAAARAADGSTVRACDLLEVSDAPVDAAPPPRAEPRAPRPTLEFDFDPSAPGRAL
ncbi:MAG TPA: hypothetical protein VGM56_03395 [Byssovorax sp.]|jgi:hypothetical protein